MIYSIQNEHISVAVHRHGAQLQSIRDPDGTEYLWQGDPAYWKDRSPNLFPYIGRMIHKQYTYKGRVYPMDIHGFASDMDFKLVQQANDCLVFELCHSEKTLRQYPWKFRFRIKYTITGCRLDILFTVENLDDSAMLFAVGGHPGFNVPMKQDEAFSDWRLRFSGSCQPERICFTPDCFTDGRTTPYPLDQENSIPLRHDLFDEDAIVLKNTAKCVTLEKRSGRKSVTVSFPQMEYIGFWHMPKTDAPYVCIEPWSSLPSQKGEQTDLEKQQDLLTLAPAGTYQNCWSIVLTC